MYSAKKPYLKLKSSMVDFFRSPSTFFKQFRSKFSQFEKPYLEDEYKQMHLDFPDWDWGPRKPWEFPPIGPWSPPYFPGIDPPQNVFNIPPEEDPFPCSQDGCIIIEWPPFYVEPGEFYRLHASIRVYAVVNVIIEGPVIFPNDCIEHVPPGWPLCGFYCGGWIQIKGDAQDGDAISITFVTAGGGSCCYTGEVKLACDPTAIIQYTTLQMAIDETQTLTASESGEAYTWAISSGGGSLSESEGNSTVYTAPSSNDATCSQNPTITLNCDEQVIDSITIAVNKWTGNEDAFYIWKRYHYVITCPNTWENGTALICPCNDVGGSLICCPAYYGLVDYYRCDGIWDHYNLYCSKNSYGAVANCGICEEERCPPLIAQCNTCMSDSGYTFGTEVDLRTQAMKDGGCCPEGLL